MGAGPPPFAAIVLEGRFRTPAGLPLTVKSFPHRFGAIGFVTGGVFPAAGAVDAAGGVARRSGTGTASAGGDGGDGDGDRAHVEREV